MILITSGAFVQGELVSEVGALPPSLLPIGNKRLYEYQISLVKNSFPGEDIYLSIPDSFALTDYDLAALKTLEIKLLRVAEELTLGNSILYCWNATAKHYKNLKILHGDTLFVETLLPNKNAISTHPNKGVYQRAIWNAGEGDSNDIHNKLSSDNDVVVSGFFGFSEPLYFMKSLVEQSGNFLRALYEYDKAYRFEIFRAGKWLDFGHVNSFFASRTAMTTQRAFNELSITKRYVEKYSKSKSEKIYAEGCWFDSLPYELRIHTPHLLSLEKENGTTGFSIYRLEYLYLLPLSDLYVFGKLPERQWKTVFNSIESTISDFKRWTPKEGELDVSVFDSMYLEKTIDRLADYKVEDCEREGYTARRFKLTCGCVVNLAEIAEYSAEYIRETTDKEISVCHGDFCFSNLLFDSKNESIRCIDPRGVLPNGKRSIYGDRRYDIAKLYHSVIGLYDFIIAGYYTLEESNDSLSISFAKELEVDSVIQEAFRTELLNKCGYSEKEILAITIHLFLSMLPLHSDRPDRQKAFIANAIRLFEKLLGFDK
ncbi:aminoglycoside phosphotransferase family protein [Alteromonas sp. C1M14]|uniref:aminoglycoside phosphotransferase family protein n=1 Tax=Alteromonas sp. C1M14 TaxID=2841567 RepID=UPI001C09D2ED|nr:aminoglycoside phosphotransferase family protein [Alteromonas sp. C1M14]MBU2977224.1 aminoglycoside phosphotransferase family protein [Alteromonas sp. C1M14]